MNSLKNFSFQTMDTSSQYYLKSFRRRGCYQNLVPNFKRVCQTVSQFIFNIIGCYEKLKNIDLDKKFAQKYFLNGISPAPVSDVVTPLMLGVVQ